MSAFGFGHHGVGGGGRLPQTFDEEYNCYSFAFQVMQGRWMMNDVGKVIGRTG